MGAITDKVRGMTDQVIGNVKAGVGDLTQDEQMRKRGRAQQIKGAVRRTKGDVKQKLNTL